MAAEAGGGLGKRGKRGGEMGAPPSFLDKLCSILDEPRLAERISWNQEGDGIVVREMGKFASEVLPLYFKHSNYQSFVRQLNIYGFHKTSHNEQSCEFKQPYFRRDQRHLMGLIRRRGQGTATSTKQQRERHEAADETKEIVERVYGEMRRLCNRVSQLEAEMGLINERHDALKLENQALWGIVLEEGSEDLARRASESLERLPTEVREMTFTRYQEGDVRRTRDLSPWRSSALATQSLPSPPMPPPPPPSPSLLFSGGHTDTNIDTTANNSSSVSGSDFGILPSPSHFPSLPMTGQVEQPSSAAASYSTAGASNSNNVGGIRGSFSIGTVHSTGRAELHQHQHQHQHQREIAAIEERGMPVVQWSERLIRSGNGEKSGAVAGNAARVYPGGYASSILGDARQANVGGNHGGLVTGAGELTTDDSLEGTAVNCTSPITPRGEVVRGENADGDDSENQPGPQHAVGSPIAMTAPQSMLSAEVELVTSDTEPWQPGCILSEIIPSRTDTVDCQDPSRREDTAAVASGERRSMDTD